jgi:hypothetical protein
MNAVSGAPDDLIGQFQLEQQFRQAGHQRNDPDRPNGRCMTDADGVDERCS